MRSSDQKANREPGHSDGGAPQRNGWGIRAVSSGRLWAVLSITMVVAAALLRFQFLQGLGTNAPYITFWPAVVIAALYGGLRAGFLTLSLSAVVGIYFWVEPVHTFTLRNPGDWLLLGTFLTTTALISIVAEAMHRARARAHAAVQREVAALAQHENMARLRLSAQAANLGLWDWDLKTNAVFFSPEWKSQIGYREDEISNQFEEWQSRVHPDDLEATMHIVRAFIENPQGRHKVEFRMRHKDGSYRWIYAAADILRAADGMPVRMLGCHLDITERKQAEELLRKSQENLLLATEGSKLGVWNWNTVTGELIWSDRCKSLFGIRLNEAMSYQRFRDALHPDDREKVDMVVKEALDNHKDYDIEYRSLWPDGSLHWLAAKGRGYYDATGRATRMEGVVLDITARKQAEEAFRQKAEELRARNAELEQFNRAMVGRELRMIELKQEINELCRRLGEPPRHATDQLQTGRVHGASPAPGTPGGGGA
jgi:PAS domain S-box-containing protein